MNFNFNAKLDFYRKTTFQVSFIPPTVETDGDRTYVKRAGVALLSFVPHDDAGKRLWKETVYFALSAKEAASFVANPEVEFVHANQDKTSVKNLKITPYVKDDVLKGYGLYVNMTNNGTQSKASGYLSATRSANELALVQATIALALPYLSGFMGVEGIPAITIDQAAVTAVSDNERSQITDDDVPF